MHSRESQIEWGSPPLMCSLTIMRRKINGRERIFTTKGRIRPLDERLSSEKIYSPPPGKESSLSSLWVLPIWIGFLSLQILIHAGWSGRIKNRMIARYQSPYYFRSGTLPSLPLLSSSFELGKHSLTQDSTTSTSLHCQVPFPSQII